MTLKPGFVLGFLLSKYRQADMLFEARGIGAKRKFYSQHFMSLKSTFHFYRSTQIHLVTIIGKMLLETATNQ